VLAQESNHKERESVNVKRAKSRRVDLAQERTHDRMRVEADAHERGVGMLTSALNILWMDAKSVSSHRLVASTFGPFGVFRTFSTSFVFGDWRVTESRM